MSWQWDAPSGVYKDHALSSNIREAALVRTLFPRFVRPESGYGMKKGQSMTITRILQLARAGVVPESEFLPKASPQISTKAVTVSEFGLSMEMTEFEKNLTHFDIQNQYQKLLRNNIQLTLDYICGSAIKTTPIRYVAGGTLNTNSAFGATASANLTMADLRIMKDYLSADLKCPPMSNGRYALVVATKAARGLKNDADVKAWLAYTSPAAFKRGSLGDDSGLDPSITPAAEYLGYVENVDIWETNNTDVLATGIGTAGVTAEGVMFGDDAAFLAEVEAPELRRAPVPYDLGRKWEVGWVGTLQAGPIWDTATTARSIYIGSL